MEKRAGPAGPRVSCILIHGVTAYACFCLIAYQGLLVVTSTDETSTRRDFRSAWKERPPGVNSGTCSRNSIKQTHTVRFFDALGRASYTIELMCYHGGTMRSPVLIVIFLSALCTLGLVHVLATHFYLYWKYVWLDIPVHVLGGICVAMGFALLPVFGMRISERYRGIYITLGVVLVAGICWELFEFTFDIMRIEQGYVIDTAIDLGMDLVGGAIGYFMARHIGEL